MGNNINLLCFSHASSLDLFTIAQGVPISQVSLGKWELFLIPFFSWLLIAFGKLFPLKFELYVY